MRAWSVVGLVALTGALGAAPAHAAGGLRIAVLSAARADLVTDGQALVGVTLPRTARASTLKVTVGGRDVTSAFRTRGGRQEAIVDGLRDGRNRVRATVRSRRSRWTATLTITNHPNGGPVFGGPQVQPWRCQKTAKDAQCNEPPRFRWLYRSTDPTKPNLTEFDPAKLPADVATTTTDQGVKVPFTVREEIGYQDRDQYRILVLADPRQPTWDRWNPQRTWNHKVLVPGGGGCNGDYSTGTAPLQDFSGTIPPIPGRTDSYVDALGRGFAVMSTALANTGHNCNVATEAEALMMLKERLVETYGDVRHTIGTGCSGGSVVQHTVANAYPRGVYDGLIVTCAYPDVATAGEQFAEYHLLRLYFEDPSRWGPGVVWNPVQWAAVEGHIAPVNAITADEGLFKVAIDPIQRCAGDKSYEPTSNPGGVRCSILDYVVNVLGRRPQGVWSPQEQKAGRGFAGVPFSNVGVQYGLQALKDGVITPEQFVDLNEKIGGLDIDAKLQPQRLAGDDFAIANAYRSGFVNDTAHMDDVAIIDHAGPDPGIAHDFAHTLWVRRRLDKAHGGHRNQVLWFGPTPLVGDPTWPTEALIAMDRWLAAVERDTSDRSRAHKIIADRPADIEDRCATVPGVRLPLTDSACLPPLLQTALSTPREVAGGPPANDVLKCPLRPLYARDYAPAQLSGAQLARLRTLFKDGVCDWTKPGVGQQPSLAWQTYQERDGAVVYGGRPMGRAPVSRSRRVSRR